MKDNYIDTICSMRNGSADDKQFKATVEYNFQQALKDYHNHIVEKIEDWFEDKGTNMNFDILLSLLQDTNPKE